MKFSDISSEKLIERPVGMMQRAKTKLKKAVTPGPWRAGGEGKDVIEKSANILGRQFEKWLQSQEDQKNIPVENFVKFLKQTGFQKTGQLILDQKIKEKTNKTQSSQSDQTQSSQTATEKDS